MPHPFFSIFRSLALSLSLASPSRATLHSHPQSFYEISRSSFGEPEVFEDS